ncbi:MAG: hypothetical protein AB7P00_20270 [Sandaracinaceae bacterium]
MDPAYTTCVKRCRAHPDAYERARCCADCRALYAAVLRAEREAPEPAAPTTPSYPSRPLRDARARRREVMFAASSSAAAATPRPARPLAGLASLGDAASDRRDARATAASIAAAAVLACQAINNTSDRERCVAAANAALTSANAIIDEATREPGTSDTTADEALAELRRDLEEVQSQAELQRQAELERQRQAAAAAERSAESSQQTLWLVGGGLAIAVALGVGYLVLQDDDKAAAP